MEIDGRVAVVTGLIRFTTAMGDLPRRSGVRVTCVVPDWVRTGRAEAELATMTSPATSSYCAPTSAHDGRMLRKIDCVMVKVVDLVAASEFYAEVFGLRPLWRDETSIGMGMPETDAEIVLHTMDLPADRSVFYLVDDVLSAARTAQRAGCVVVEAPFDIAIGKCAVLADPFGNTVGLLDMTKGPRAT
jgi:predicted enzyme related to lactoylglutathione lyase